jgi:hypothetical protein
VKLLPRQRAIPPVTSSPTRHVADSASAAGTKSHRGQVLVIFSGTFVVLLLMSALVIDLAWLWNNSLRIQRTADAAALAGVVFLPNDVTGAKNAADKEATRNGYDGYPSTLNGVTVTPTQDGQNPRRLNVKVTAPVKTFFLGLIGMKTITVSRQAHAEYVLPVPMGSPENYYGVFGQVRNATFTTTGVLAHPGTGTGFNSPATSAAGVAPAWTSPNNVMGASDSTYASSSATNGSFQDWYSFSFSFNATVTSIDGIQVSARGRTPSGTGSGNQTNCTLQVQLSWNGGTNWTAAKTQVLTTSNTLYTLPAATNDTWGHAWTTAQLANGSANFRVRLSILKPAAVPPAGAGCSATRIAQVDTLQAAVWYNYQTNTTTTTTASYPLTGPGSACTNGAANCFVGTAAGSGQPLNTRGFWGTMNTQGAENVNGDAFQPYYDTRTGGVALTCPTATPKACHGPVNYYNYAIEMQPNTSGGRVYIFDPVFCQTDNDRGTGDRWFGGSASVSSFYELYSDPNNTPFILGDDVLVASSGNTFRQISASDYNMTGFGSNPGPTSSNHCEQRNTAYGDARDYHDSWYLLNPGGSGLTGSPTGTTYRLHTTGTDPNAVTQQLDTNGEQSFAIYATSAQAQAGGGACRVLVPPASCGYPRVYGLGAMQAFTPLSAGGATPTVASSFYLAQIDPIHKTKTLEVRLWDPGDTAPLSASIQILYPDASCGAVAGTCLEVGYRAAAVTFSSEKGTTNANANSGCSPAAAVGNWKRTTASTAGITTSTGASLGIFNGCWLTIDAVIPASYNGNSVAPNDFSWWKIRYTMNYGGSLDTSNDVTTWTADIRGNPVHLVEP